MKPSASYSVAAAAARPGEYAVQRFASTPSRPARVTTAARIVAKNSGRRLRVGLGADFGASGASTKDCTMSTAWPRRAPEQRGVPPPTPHGMHRRCVNSGRQFELAAAPAANGPG